MPTLLAFAAVHLSEFTFLLFLCQKTPCIYVVQCAWYRCRSLLACAWSVRAPTCIRCGNFHHKTNFLLFLFKKIYTNSKLNKIWLSFALKCRLRCLYSFTWCRIFFLGFLHEEKCSSHEEEVWCSNFGTWLSEAFTGKLGIALCVTFIQSLSECLYNYATSKNIYKPLNNPPSSDGIILKKETKQIAF